MILFFKKKIISSDFPEFHLFNRQDQEKIPFAWLFKKAERTQTLFMESKNTLKLLIMQKVNERIRSSGHNEMYFSMSSCTEITLHFYSWPELLKQS